MGAGLVAFITGAGRVSGVQCEARTFCHAKRPVRAECGISALLDGAELLKLFAKALQVSYVEICPYRVASGVMLKQQTPGSH